MFSQVSVSCAFVKIANGLGRMHCFGVSTFSVFFKEKRNLKSDKCTPPLYLSHFIGQKGAKDPPRAASKNNDRQKTPGTPPRSAPDPPNVPQIMPRTTEIKQKAEPETS